MALQRIGSLPTALRLSVLSSPQAIYTARTFPGFQLKLSRFSINARPLTRRFSRKAFWFAPIAGGLALYLLPYPSTHAPFPSFFASPTLIPCSQQTPSPSSSHRSLLNSPSEPQLSIIKRVLQLLRDRIWEPIRTATRFIHLAALFIPVVLMTPMLLVGPPEEQWQGDRWGAVWWYDLLAARMEAAGPTFIKVRSLLLKSHIIHIHNLH